jgi:hypothetical protein
LDAELAGGFHGWNTFDTDNNETKAGQETQETAASFVAARVSFYALSRVPAELNAVSRRGKQFAVSVPSVKSVESVFPKSSWRPERVLGFAELPIEDFGIAIRRMSRTQRSPHTTWVGLLIQHRSIRLVRRIRYSKKPRGVPSGSFPEKRSMSLGKGFD